MTAIAGSSTTYFDASRTSTVLKESPILMGGILCYGQKIWLGIRLFRRGHAVLVFPQSLEDIEQVYVRYFCDGQLDSNYRSSRVYGHLANAVVDKSPLLIASPFQKKSGKLSKTQSEFIPLSSCRRLLTEADNLGACKFGLLRSVPDQADTTFIFKTSSTADYMEWLKIVKRSLRIAKRSSRVIVPLPTNFPPERFASPGPDVDSESEVSSRQLSIVANRFSTFKSGSRIVRGTRSLGFLRPFRMSAAAPSILQDYPTDTECGSQPRISVEDDNGGWATQF
ncbi:hypothetical protein BC829DRAFT_257858 [Chytridium lagenaria]|nr:hypothetical protein BC829DRAFT_257858 [Chytridium lagenaria]